jgi:hypothetical protein
MKVTKRILKDAERLLKLPEAELDRPDRIERIREAIIDAFGDDPETASEYKNLSVEKLFNHLHAANKKAKRLQTVLLQRAIRIQKSLDLGTQRPRSIK